VVRERGCAAGGHAFGFHRWKRLWLKDRVA